MSEFPVPEAADRQGPALNAAASEPRETLAADNRRVAALAAVDFTGPLWDDFAHDLAEYAYPVIRVWIVTRRIYRECAKKGIHFARRLPHTLTQDDADEIALETIARALVGFRRLLREGGWSPQMGVRLTTLFIGQCMLRFSNVARDWARHGEGAPAAAVSLDDLEDKGISLGDGEDLDPFSDPATVAAVKDEAERILAAAEDPRTREILRHRIADLNDAQIAAALGVTKKAVESALYRFRKLVRPDMLKGGA